MPSGRGRTSGAAGGHEPNKRYQAGRELVTHVVAVSCPAIFCFCPLRLNAIGS